ncbi:recombination-associated protein RdgC [Avibacterium paragallinarum]|uniref:Recombination-associated protein RdgC n=1 Tax=Avibacterium paragallinarum TaxID=728 RepID=A0A0F5EW47_AVIPA|nr:recombination-associated protein RdgC [Avibacterium paragallinarum]KAA6207942.1 recombination-associated protein RdgC [Avibacterium paragallinarum]KKB00818.1 recombinase RdgC [Avibacterium paragallinarum]POY46094.1 recombination-associated protein RdgC [Avibacterium paragallinarum]RZN67857.1 recombination-associated protein RdgC [Avibacterium paragallinarum]RZN74035.1 recombination-associated protein RdgC [Avibacterium paragallinarum]
MFWFKNAMIYRLTKAMDFSNLSSQLEACEFTPCGSSEASKFGWIAPLSTSEQLCFEANGQILLVAQREEKILPNYVVTKELTNRVKALEEKEGRKLKKVERLSIKDDVVASLLPQAFTRSTYTALWIDTQNQLIYVDAASAKRAEDALALLRKSLGSLPVIPLAFANDASLVMTNWVNEAPDWLTVLEEAELTGLKEDGIAKFKRQYLDSNEIYSLLEAGKVVTKIALEWEGNLSFVLCDDGTLKRLKFADEIKEKNDDIAKEDIAQCFDADFLLMAATISELTKRLLNEFGGEKESI